MSTVFCHFIHLWIAHLVTDKAKAAISACHINNINEGKQLIKVIDEAKSENAIKNYK